MRSSASTRAGSRSRRTSSAATPSFAIVGLADRACQEAKERVRSGIASAELELPGPPHHRQPRAGRAAQGRLRLRSPDRARGARGLATSCRPDALDGIAAFGELALDGRVRPVPGALVAAEGARRSSSDRLVCAAESGAEVALAGVEPIPVHHLADAVAYLRGDARAARAVRRRRAAPRRVRAPDLARRPRAGARPPRARDRRRRRAQPPARRPAGNGQDDARAPAAGHPAAARRRRGARGHAHPLGRRRPPARRRSRSCAAVPRAAPLGVGAGDRRRRRQRAATRRSEPRAPRRALPRRVPGVRTAGARVAAAAARGRRRRSSHASPGARASRRGSCSSRR